MKKLKINVAMLMAAFFSVSAFAAAPVSDVTTSNGYQQNDTQIKRQIEQLTRLLETRNRMQVRLQNRLDELAREMSEMRGSIELFNYKIEQVENRQRNLYQLIDDLSKPPVEAVAVNVDSAESDDKIAYQQALNLVLVNKEYQQAVTAFEAFVIDHPQSSYLANAYYWLGQLLNKEKKFNEAKTAFMAVVDKYPDSNKRPDALYKIGFIDEYLGDISSAKVFYSKVVSEFPDSSAAELSKKRLESF